MTLSASNLSDYNLPDTQNQESNLVPYVYGTDYGDTLEPCQGEIELEESDIKVILQEQIESLTSYLDQIAELVKLAPILKKRVKIYRSTLAKLNTLPNIE